MASLVATKLWDQLQEHAFDAVRRGTDPDIAARQLLAGTGGDRRTVLATRLRLAAAAGHTPTALDSRRALALLDRAIAVADADGLWHPVFGDS